VRRLVGANSKGYCDPPNEGIPPMTVVLPNRALQRTGLRPAAELGRSAAAIPKLPRGGSPMARAAPLRHPGEWAYDRPVPPLTNHRPWEMLMPRVRVDAPCGDG
jgi:hypothetical protein